MAADTQLLVHMAMHDTGLFKTKLLFTFHLKLNVEPTVFYRHEIRTDGKDS